MSLALFWVQGHHTRVSHGPAAGTYTALQCSNAHAHMRRSFPRMRPTQSDASDGPTPRRDSA